MAAEPTVEEQESNAVTEKKGRATPSRRQNRNAKASGAKSEQSGNALTSPIYATMDYFNNVRGEMQKVSWPTQEDTRHLTILCINVTIASAILLGGLSVILTAFIELGLNPGNAWVLLAVIVAMVAGAFAAIRSGRL